MENSIAEDRNLSGSPADSALLSREKEIPEYLLIQLSDYINENLGLYFPQDRWRTLKRSMAAAARDLDETGKPTPNVVTFINRLLASPPTQKILDILARRLTIGETYFFRDMYLFDVLRDSVLPEIIQKRQYEGKRLYFWSAGCCTGEEPYTLSIILDQMLPDKLTWKIMVLATDINTHFIEKAKNGIYTTWSFRETPKWILDAYFHKTPTGGYKIVPSIQKRVTFVQHNLAEDSYPLPISSFLSLESERQEGLDIVFCRNVLMYFKPEQRSAVIQKFSNSLKPGGWFIISPGETGYVKLPDFKPVNFSGVLLYRKIIRSSRAYDPSIKLEDRRINAGMKVPSGFDKNQPSDYSDKKNSIAENEDFRLATDHFNTNRFNETVEILKKMIAGDNSKIGRFQTNPEFLYLMARSLFIIGEIEEAAKWCERAIKFNKSNIFINYLQAIVYKEIGMFEESKKSLKQVLFLDPEFALAHFALGNLTRQEGKINESNHHCQKALSLLSTMNPSAILPHGSGVTVETVINIIGTILDTDK